MLETEQGLIVIKIDIHQLDKKKQNPVFSDTVIYQTDQVSYHFEVTISIQPDDTFLAEGHALAETTQECSKCLQDVAVKREIHFSDLYLKHSEDLDKYETVFEGNLFAANDNQIDLCQSIEAALAESDTWISLCNEQCKGLCVHCGKDLNQSDCQCCEDVIDPRLEALKNLKL